MREVLESRPIRDVTSPLRIQKHDRVLLLVEAICLEDANRVRKADDVAEHVALLEVDRVRLVASLP